jgi:ribosomal protein S18 acetylase RimI-like enzyme
MWKTVELTDERRILDFLETDRLYAAYAIGDLEADLFAQCTWVGAETGERLQALALRFSGLEPPALFLMGDTEGLRAILEGATYPERVYLTCRPAHLPLTRAFYRWDRTIAMWRMALKASRFRPGVYAGACVRLTSTHVDRMTRLFALGGGIAFSPTQVAQGIFYGVLAAGQLVAVAGTHLVSPAYGVAAVGNVFTHPDHRGRGYGTATTAAVVAELLQHGIRDIVINVSQENAVAVRIYERLGFERYCSFLEGPASRAASTLP